MATRQGASSVPTEDATGWEELLAVVQRERAICVERTLSYMATMPTYGKLDPEALRLGVRANFDAVLAGLKHRRLPGAPDDTESFEGRGAVRARQGLPVTEMLAAWRAGQESLYVLARDLAPDVPDRDALLLEFLEMVIAWADFAMLAAADGHRRTELSRAREQHQRDGRKRYAAAPSRRGTIDDRQPIAIIRDVKPVAGNHHKAVPIRPPSTKPCARGQSRPWTARRSSSI